MWNRGIKASQSAQIRHIEPKAVLYVSYTQLPSFTLQRPVTRTPECYRERDQIQKFSPNYEQCSKYRTDTEDSKALANCPSPTLPKASQAKYFTTREREMACRKKCCHCSAAIFLFHPHVPGQKQNRWTLNHYYTVAPCNSPCKMPPWVTAHVTHT